MIFEPQVGFLNVVKDQRCTGGLSLYLKDEDICNRMDVKDHDLKVGLTHLAGRGNSHDMKEFIG